MRRRGRTWGRLGRSWGRHATAGAAIVALVCVIVLSAGSAHATSDTVIGFDNLTRGTVVTTQYQTAGVEFGHAADFGKPSPGNGDCGAPTVATGAVPAYSSPNYAVLATCGGYAGTFGKLLDYSRARVSVEVINLQASGPAASVTLTGYDDAGNAVATASGSAGSAWLQLIATQPAGSGTPRITSFAITASTSAAGAVPSVAIDNLAFDQAGAPLSAAGTPISATAGSPFSGSVATITDGDPTAVASDFTATITWGDGAGSAGTVSAAGGGSFTVSGSHTWQAPGSYPVHVAVTKVNGRTAGADLVATVTTSGGGGGGGGGGSQQAVISLLTPNPVAGGIVTFSGAGSRPGSGTIISYD